MTLRIDPTIANTPYVLAPAEVPAASVLSNFAFILPGSNLPAARYLPGGGRSQLAE